MRRQVEWRLEIDPEKRNQLAYCIRNGPSCAGTMGPLVLLNAGVFVSE